MEHQEDIVHKVEVVGEVEELEVTPPSDDGQGAGEHDAGCGQESHPRGEG